MSDKNDLVDVIDFGDEESLQRIAEAFKSKRQFVITTIDKDFNPLGNDKHSADVWLGAAGGGLLMTIGAGAVALAFFDLEPTSKLGLLVGGGLAVCLAGGGVLITVIVTRRGYTSSMRYNQTTKLYEWVLTPG